MITADRADNRLNGMEVHIVHNAAMTRQAISTSHVPLSPTLYSARSCHTRTQSHLRCRRKPWTDRGSRSISADCRSRLATMKSTQRFYRVSTHQLQTAALSVEVGVDIPHTQPRVDGVTQSTAHWTKLLLQITAIRSQTQTRDDIGKLGEFQHRGECVHVVNADNAVDSSRDYLSGVFVEAAGGDLEWMGDGLYGLVTACIP